MDVAIRADSSSQIGTGHLMRCLTLADAMARRGAKVAFLMASSGEPWRALVETRGHRFVPIVAANASIDDPSGPSLFHAGWLPWSQAADAAAVAAALPTSVDLLIVDHYALDARWESRLRVRTRRMMAIDDIADRRHDVDILLDQNPQDPTTDRYSGLVPATARKLIGPNYALLRPEFSRLRTARRPQRGHVERIVVFMGGTDYAGGTLPILATLSAPSLTHISVDVIIGGQSPHLTAIAAAVQGRGGCALHVDAGNVAELFATTDLALGAGGVAALERCCLALPTIAVAIAANQEPALEVLARRGALLYLGRIETFDAMALRDAILGLMAEPGGLKRMSEAASRVVDGRGVERVLDVLWSAQ